LPALWLGACPLQAADHFIVLGSGGVPAAQEASIFEVADFWRTELGRRYRPAQTTVLFGAGNQPGRKPFYADVRIQREAEAKPGEVLAFETLEPGRLRRNQPATPANLASALTRHLRAPGQVWLFAHGHGSPEPTLPEFHPDRFRHNRLLLWQAEPTQQQAPTEPAPFTVPELRNRLAAPGRKADFVFLITSCYSGGFHQAIVGDDDRRPVIQRGAAGFTAAHEDLASAGCTTTPDFWQDTYVGLFAGKFAAGNPPGKVRRPALTLTEAHRAAVLALPAWSFELPLATSDYYLERWTEALLSEHPGDQAVWGERRQAAQTAFTAAWKQPATPAPAPWTRHRRWVEDVIARTPGLDQPRRRAALANPVSARQMLAELHQRKQVAAQLLAEAETQTAAAGPAVAAAWHQYFPQLAGASGRPKALLAEHAWEPEAAAAETADPDPLRWPDQLFNRHSHLAATDPARFDALGRWLARRAELRDTWIVQTLAGDLTAANPTVAALTEWRQRTLQHVAADGAALTAETEWANFRRAVIYREVSAAWFALAAIEDTRALADLAELHRLESLTLPAPGRK
jgi:hypothetical protein